MIIPCSETGMSALAIDAISDDLGNTAQTMMCLTRRHDKEYEYLTLFALAMSSRYSKRHYWSLFCKAMPTLLELDMFIRYHGREESLQVLKGFLHDLNDMEKSLSLSLRLNNAKEWALSINDDKGIELFNIYLEKVSRCYYRIHVFKVTNLYMERLLFRAREDCKDYLGKHCLSPGSFNILLCNTVNGQKMLFDLMTLIANDMNPGSMILSTKQFDCQNGLKQIEGILKQGDIRFIFIPEIDTIGYKMKLGDKKERSRIFSRLQSFAESYGICILGVAIDSHWVFPLDAVRYSEYLPFLVGTALDHSPLEIYEDEHGNDLRYTIKVWLRKQIDGNEILTPIITSPLQYLGNYINKYVTPENNEVPF